MVHMDDTDGICEAVESGDLHGCQDCHMVSDCRYCPDCDEGRCAICGALIKKGDEFTCDPSFGDVFCAAPGCSDVAEGPSVAALAASVGR